MKKLLLLLSFLALQLLAVECTQEQYKPFFVKNSDRYIYAGTSVFGDQVFDKNTIIYDKESQKVICWVINQMIDNSTAGIYKILWEFDLKNNQVRVIQAQSYKCNGEAIDNESKSDWYHIIPNSGNELALNILKKYLNIK